MQETNIIATVEIKLIRFRVACLSSRPTKPCGDDLRNPVVTALIPRAMQTNYTMYLPCIIR